MLPLVPIPGDHCYTTNVQESKLLRKKGLREFVTFSGDGIVLESILGESTQAGG